MRLAEAVCPAKSPGGGAVGHLQEGDVDASLAAKLAKTDWDFPDRVAHSPIEGLHPYPAKFVADLPRVLLHALPVPAGTAVLDPFCGSGTTLVECQRLGLASVGVDLNPIACLISRVKTSPAPGNLRKSAAAVVNAARCADCTTVPQIPNLDHWFKAPVQRTLAALRHAVAEAPSSHREALRLALSSIVVRVSNQDSDTRYAAVNKQVSGSDVFTAFLQAAGRIQAALEARDYPLAPATVLEADTLRLDTSHIPMPIGAVVTSPPYPNAYEYWLYHKYRMYWLGFDPLAVKAHEIGARAHFFKRNGHTAEHFAEQMADTFARLRQVLVRNGYVCFVIGRSRIHGRMIDNAKIVGEVAEKMGFVRAFRTERVLSAKRKSFNPSYGSIKQEAVLVLQRKGG